MKKLLQGATLIFLTIMIVSHMMYAQQIEGYEGSRTEIDTNFIADYSSLLSLKFFGVLKSNQIGHYDNWTQRYVYYRPNENFNVGLGFVYKWLGLDLALSLPFINNDDAIFGKTKRFDIQLNIYQRRFIFDFNYQTYKGYYGSNSPEYIPNFDFLNPSYPIRPDISTFNIALNALYIFKSDRFSYRAAFVFSERQTKSAGSWIAGSYLSHFKMNADSSIVPSLLRNEFNPEADFRNTKYSNTGISGGYGHTFVIGKKMFFSISVALGIGPVFRFQPGSSTRNSNTEIEAAVRAVARSSIGFNGRKFYGGISVVSSQSSELDLNTPHLERNINNFKIFIGRRVNPPKVLEKFISIF